MFKFFLNKKSQLIIFICLALFFLNLHSVQAVGTILPPCWQNGDCKVCDLVGVGVSIGVIILEFVGALVLLVFIYGGFILLTSAGQHEKINKGKGILVNAVIGLFIVLFAYAGVNIISRIFTGGFSWEEKLACGATQPPVPTPPPPTPTPPPAETKEYCDNICATQKCQISLSDVGKKFTRAESFSGHPEDCTAPAENYKTSIILSTCTAGEFQACCCVAQYPKNTSCTDAGFRCKPCTTDYPEPSLYYSCEGGIACCVPSPPQR